jgi:hypothetical protein
MIYQLLNPCYFTHLITRDNEVLSNYKSQSYYQLAFSYFVKILKFHVINSHGVTCNVFSDV